MCHNVISKLPNETQLKAILLSPSDIAACFTLQENVRQKLIGEGTPHYLKPFSLDQFAKHFADGGKVIGVKDEEGKLVAMARLSFPNQNDQRNYPDMDLTGTATVSGVAVSKTGQNLAVVMLEFAKIVAAKHGCDAIAGKVAWSNGASHKQFRKAGFEKAAEGGDNFQGLDYHFVCFRWPMPA